MECSPPWCANWKALFGKCTRGRRRLQLMSNICYEGTCYKSVKKWAEDRCLWRVLEMEVNDLLSIAVHRNKIIIRAIKLPKLECVRFHFLCPFTTPISSFSSPPFPSSTSPFSLPCHSHTLFSWGLFPFPPLLSLSYREVTPQILLESLGQHCKLR